jgi:hypothetical protein
MKMSFCEFKMDLGDAGEFEFVVEYAYYPPNKAQYPGEKDEGAYLNVMAITYGGIDWTKQLGKILEKDEGFLNACHQEWLDEVAEHQLRLAGV